MPRPGSATPATKNPDKKQGRRRPSRHCSWGRWPRFSQLAFGPHPSRHGYECIDSSPAPAFSKKTFGEARAATIESGIFSPTGRFRGQRPQLQKIQIQNHHLGGDAATGTGYAGPGFHTWPLSHIPQDTDPKPRGPCPNGATHTSPGCNPGNLPPHHSPRPEGTPHRRPTLVRHPLIQSPIR